MNATSTSTTSTPTLEVRGPYTDAPDLHPNLILGSLHLLFWVFAHPAAWRNYVARIDPTLPPDFSLVDISAEQMRIASLRRLRIQIYVVLPLLAMFVLAIATWLVNGFSRRAILDFYFVDRLAFMVPLGVMLGVSISSLSSLAWYGMAAILLISEITSSPAFLFILFATVIQVGALEFKVYLKERHLHFQD